MVNPLELLGYAGNFLDLPGSSVRDLLTGQNPFDQWMTPFSGDNRASGRDVLRPLLGANKETGMSGWLSDPMEGVKDVIGFGAEVALDPMNFVSGGAVLRAIKGGKATRQANAVNALREAGKYSYVNPRVLARQADEAAPAMASVAEQNPMKLLGYTPERETVFHGGRDWSASATPEHPYGVFDTGRLKTGEGNNAYGPGMYAADEAVTSERYKGYVDNMDPEMDPVSSAMLRQRLSETLTPGREIPVQEMTGPLDGVGYVAEDLFERSRFSDRPGYEFIGAKIGNPDGVGGYEVLAGIQRPDGTVKYYSAKDIGEEYAGGYTPGLYENDWLDYFGIQPQYVQPQGRLYQLDMPTGSKDRFMNWDARMADQPQNVQSAITSMPGMDMANKVAELEAQSLAIHNQMREARVRAGARPGDWGFTNDELKSLREQYQKVNDEAERLTVKIRGRYGYQAGMLRDGGATGRMVADLLMGNTPSSATLAETAGLREAGVPGMKNLSHATPGSYNYAIWDQDLINQMRIRAIDGERVPINPTTLVQQVEQPTFRAAAGDSPLVSTMNPMRPQAVPSVLRPLAAGAAYNALARQNQYGGIM
jgi:hypothetical protein